MAEPTSRPDKGGPRHLGSKELRSLTDKDDPNKPSLAVFLLFEALEWTAIVFVVWLAMHFIGSFFK